MARGAAAAVGRDLRALFGAGTVAGLGDAELLARFVAGGLGAEPAFAALVDRHAPGVLRVCRGVLDDPHDVEDASQATFLVLARRASAVRRADALACWLFGVALRVSRRVRTAKARRLRHEARGAAIAALRREDATRPESWVELYEELGRLPERYRRPLVLCHLEGLSYSEAARRLRCPDRTIQTRLIRGRALLKARLIRRGLAPSAAILAAGALTGLARAVEVPTGWASATVTAATGTASGTAVTASLVHARGVLRAMTFAKIKLTALSGAIISAALAGLLPLAQGQKPPDPPPPIVQAIRPEPPPEANDQAARPKEGEFTITVIANDTGKPLPGATVRISMDLKLRVLTADVEGRVTWDRSDRKFPDKELIVDVWADGYVQQRYFFSETNPKYPEAKGTFKVRLLPGEETFGGTVNDEDSQPIAGATVALWGYLGEMKDPHELAYKVDTKTDDQGRWRLMGLRKMRWASLYFSHPEFLADDNAHHQQFGDTDAREPSPELQPLRDFAHVHVMTRGVEVKARVLDGDGKPIGGASVTWLMAADRNRFGSEPIWATTNADGRVTFPHVRPGALLLVAKAPGHAPEIRSAKTSAGTAATEIRLGPANTIAGRVVDSECKPIAGAFVIVHTWREFQNLHLFLATDREGRFRWDEAPADPVLINVDKAGYMDVFNDNVSPGSDLEFTLKRLLKISGTVRDLETRKRIERIEVEVGVVNPKDDSVRWGSAQSLASSDQGNLYVRLDAEAAPAYRLRLKARGYEPFVTREIKTDEVEATLEVGLAKIRLDGSALTGRVFDPEGTPLAGAQLAIVGLEPDRLTVEDGKIPDRDRAPRVTSDTEGRFAVPAAAMAEGDIYRVVVTHERGYAEVDRRDFEDIATLTTQPWGRIEGTLMIGEKPDPGVEMEFIFDRIRDLNIPDISGKGTATTDADGRFTFERVAPGDIRVVPRYKDERRGQSYGVLAEVKPGETARVALGGTGRPVVARIVPPEGFDPKLDYATHSKYSIESDREMIPKGIWGAPDGRAQRWWNSPEGREYRGKLVQRSDLKIAPDGSIRVDDLPPDRYRLHITYSADPIYRRVGDPGRNAYADLKFEVPEGQGDEPLDLGVIQPQVRETPKDRK